MEEIKDRIKRLREEKGWTTTELGQKVEKGQPTISNIENGKTLLKADDILPFAKALGVSEYYLLTGIEVENHSAVEETGLSNEAIIRIRNLTDKQKTLLEMLLCDDGSVTDPEHEPEDGFMDALANYANDPVGNRIVEIIDNPDDQSILPKIRQARHSLRIQLADGSIHEVSEWKTDSKSMLSRLKTIKAKYLKSLKPMQYISTEEEDDDE